MTEQKEWTNFEARLKTNWHDEDGKNQIHLDGEMDFLASRPMEEVYETLHERAKQVGGLVKKSKDGSTVEVSTQYGVHHYKLIAEDSSEPVKKIISVDEKNDVTRMRDMDELEEQAEKAEKVREALEDADIEVTLEKP